MKQQQQPTATDTGLVHGPGTDEAAMEWRYGMQPGGKFTSEPIEGFEWRRTTAYQQPALLDGTPVASDGTFSVAERRRRRQAVLAELRECAREIEAEQLAADFAALTIGRSKVVRGFVVMKVSTGFGVNFYVGAVGAKGPGSNFPNALAAAREVQMYGTQS